MSESPLSDVSSVLSRESHESTSNAKEAADDADAIPKDAASDWGPEPRLALLETFEELDEHLGPPIEFVHVAVVTPTEGLHRVSAILPDSKAKITELLFKLDLDDLLVGDLVEAAVEQQAIYLLQALVTRAAHHMSEPADDSKKRLNPVFALVAYDIGGAIVSMAIWLAAKHPDIFPHVFFRTFTVVFSGCPQRAPDGETGVRQAIANVLRQELVKRQYRKVTPRTFASLARLMIRAAGLFVASKYTLRSRVISVYANNGAPGPVPGPVPGLITRSITEFVGSVGIPTEIRIQERPQREQLYLSVASAVKLNYDAIPSPMWEDLDDMLLRLSSPHTQYHFDFPFSPISLQRIRSNASFTCWRDTPGVQILYIAEASRGPALEIAHKIMMAGTGNPYSPAEPARCLDVSFSSQYNDIPSMVASMLAQDFAFGVEKRGNVVSAVIRNQLVFRNGWNRRSTLSVLEYAREILSHTSVLLLQNFDCCRKEEREAFLNYLNDLAERSEWAFKLIITSTTPNALKKELGSWLVLDASDVADRPADEQIYEPRNLLRQVPTEELRADIERELDKLRQSSAESTSEVLRLLGDCSGWPLEASAACLAEFQRLLRIISSTRSMEEAIERIVRSRILVKGFDTAFGLLLYAHRQLTLRELIFITLHQKDSEAVEFSDSHAASMMAEEQAISISLEQALRGLVDYDTGLVLLRPDVQRVLSSISIEVPYMTNDLRTWFHSAIFELCFSLITSKVDEASLSSMAETTTSAVDSTRPVSRSMLLRREMIQYAIQALPHHLKECPQSTIARVVSPDSESISTALLAWARAYWAASSQLTRMPGKPESHMTILSMFGIGSFDDLMKDRSSFLGAVLASRMTTVQTWLEKGDPDAQALTDALVCAVQAGNEALAVMILGALTSHHRDRIIWPATILRAAVSSRMPELVELLLKNGVNPSSRENYASIEADIGYLVKEPLTVACDLGMVKTFHILLDAEATEDVAGIDQSYFLLLAARHGGPDMVKFIIERSLYTDWEECYLDALGRAAYRGNWRACQVLLDRGQYSDIDSNKHASTKLKGLHDACRSRYSRTAKELLDHGADPNKALPDGNGSTPLWTACLFQCTTQTIRDLVSHGADPNATVGGETILCMMFGAFRHADDDGGLAATVDVLMSHATPVEINARGSHGWNALMAASSTGKLAMVDWLISHGADPESVNDFGETALSFALYRKHPDVVRRLLQEGPELNGIPRYGTPLIFDAISHPEILTMLLDAGADIEIADEKGKRPIHRAVIGQHEDVLNMLLDRKVDVNTKDALGRPPVYYAVENGSVDTFRLLIERGAKLGDLTESASLLHAALRRKSPYVLENVLEFRKFLDLEARDEDDDTPLMHAKVDIGCWRLMVNTGANLNAMGENKWTPLHLAVEPDMAEFRSVLLSQPDIDVERGGIFGPPLYWACRWLQIEAVRDLIAAGASVHPKPASPTYRRATPLVAALHGDPEQEGQDQLVETQIELIRLLISHGCDVREKIQGSLFHGVLSLACLFSAPDLVTVLLDEGALAGESSPIGIRCPLHYAAANGISTFKIIFDAYDGDLMVKDEGGKHCLHWAAQSGNAQTVRFILDQLKQSQNGRVADYINTLDIDGWSPLCWAIRPFKDWRNIQREKAETSNFEGTVRILLDNGADPDIKCRLVNQDQDEMVSVLELARRRGAGSAVIDMLQSTPPPNDQSSSDPAKDVPLDDSMDWVWCDICFAAVLESEYECSDCEAFYACSKCYRNIQMYHNAKTQGDEKLHSFKLVQDEAADSSPQKSEGNHSERAPVIIKNVSAGAGDDATEDLSDEDVTLDLSDDDES